MRRAVAMNDERHKDLGLVRKRFNINCFLQPVSG